MKYLYTFLIVFSLFSFGQSINENAKKLSNAEQSKSFSIKSNFSSRAIVAYQNQGEKLIKDFYDKLSLISQKNIDESTKDEISKSINALFLMNNVVVKDIFKQDNQDVILASFIEKVKNKDLSFEVKDFNEINVYDNFFITNYTLVFNLNGEKKIVNIQQHLYLFMKNKTFGNTTKSVWELRLANINVQ